MDYRQDIDVQKTFYKHEISQAILSLFMLLVAFDVFRNMNAIMPQNRWWEIFLRKKGYSSF